MEYINSPEFATSLDKQDPLAHYRDQFLIPQINGKDTVYFCGNSLGLQPKTAKNALEQELNDWAALGVEGHLHAKNPWWSYHEMFSKPLARLVGAQPEEVVAMNGLTVNLHLLMISFYQPNSKRKKILFEEGPFSSDRYAMASQAQQRNLDPDDVLVEMRPRKGEHTLRTEDIIAKIEELGEELALVMFGGVNYYTGQVFDMHTVTEAAHRVGAIAGFDLAHAMGNIPMYLHEWNVDFACWCSYKYLNSGPGSVSGIYVHERHGNNPELLRLAGWWGNDPDTRFQMPEKFIPSKGASGWQLSNAPIFSMAVHKASLDILEKAGIGQLRKKSEQLTGYLEFIINDINQKVGNVITIITPKNKDERGCQLSLIFKENGKAAHDAMMKHGVISDWRNPDVMRIAPVPLYNTYTDVWTFGDLLLKQLHA